MSGAEIIFEKSFSPAEQEIVDCFVGFQEALIEGDADVLSEILLDDFKSVQIPGRIHSKSEFLSQLSDGSLDFSKSDIFEPAVLFDGDGAASFIGKVRLTVKVNGRELRWISNTVACFEKIDGKWYFSRWEY